jgi:hypothetical protein
MRHCDLCGTVEADSNRATHLTLCKITGTSEVLFVCADCLRDIFTAPKTCGECKLFPGGCDGYVHPNNPAPCGK